MSFRKKMLAAARCAVVEERGRVLWVLDEIETGLVKDFNKKILAESQRHAAEVKLQIFRSLCAHVRKGIISGVQPAPKKTEVPDVLPEEL